MTLEKKAMGTQPHKNVNFYCEIEHRQRLVWCSFSLRKSSHTHVFWRLFSSEKSTLLKHQRMFMPALPLFNSISILPILSDCFILLSCVSRDAHTTTGLFYQIWRYVHHQPCRAADNMGKGSASFCGCCKAFWKFIVLATTAVAVGRNNTKEQRVPQHIKIQSTKHPAKREHGRKMLLVEIAGGEKKKFNVRK